MNDRKAQPLGENPRRSRLPVVAILPVVGIAAWLTTSALRVFAVERGPRISQSQTSVNLAAAAQGEGSAELGEVLKELRALNEPVPKPSRLPSVAEIQAMEAKLGLKFHPDYVRFLLEASDVVFGTLELATITDAQSHTYLPLVAAEGWEIGVDRSWLPICEDNGDYYVLKSTGEVMYWSHDGLIREESWPNLATWIREVWIGEAKADDFGAA